MKNKAPSYYSYFTQGENPNFLFNESEHDLSWIDALNANAAAEKSKRINEDLKNGRNPCNSFSSSEEQSSKDVGSVDFPSYYEWPDDFKDAFNKSVKECDKKTREIAATAETVFEFEGLKIYADCADGNSYFCTPFYAHGDIAVADISQESAFDSVETAVYAFINDHKEWQETNLEAYKKQVVVEQLESLRDPVYFSDDVDECEHADLGSLGYKHGEIVKCPHCGNRAEVW